MVDTDTHSFGKKNIVIGAGPSGLGCAYTLSLKNQPVLVIEKENTPGGLCRTINFSDYLFDIGGHRFLSQSDEINKLWLSILGENLLHVQRLSRIVYRGKYFSYPLNFFNTFFNLGVLETSRCIASYARCKLFKPGDNNTFEGWIINNFGKKLYEIFFKNYTEKVWAVACENLSADWAAQRIRGLSLRIAIQNALWGRTPKTPKTISDYFFYPKYGPGEFYTKLQKLTTSYGAEFAMGRTVTEILHNGEKILSLRFLETGRHDNETTKEECVDYLFSSMPLPALVRSLRPAAPQEILSCADALHFRSLLVVNIILNKPEVFPDQWLYIHSPKVKLGRIQNYKNWSPSMVVDTQKTSLGLEYFCSPHDKLWHMHDVDLINYAMKELEKIGIASHKHLINGFIIRCPTAYPFYSLEYKTIVGKISRYLEKFSNLQTIGRAGLFHYDNSDHALLSGIYAARNFLGETNYNLWETNTDGDYLEAQ